MSDADVRRLEQRIAALEAQFAAHLREHQAMQQMLAEITGGVRVIRWLVSSGLVAGAVALAVALINAVS